MTEKQKAYYEAKKEKISDYRKQYYEKNKEKIAERVKTYYEKKKNNENFKLKQKSYYDKNKDFKKRTSKDMIPNTFCSRYLVDKFRKEAKEKDYMQ